MNFLENEKKKTRVNWNWELNHLDRRKLDLNRASQAELEALPGIGPKRASAIVRWRVEHRPFVELEDLVKVPGIGPATLERLRPLAVVRP